MTSKLRLLAILSVFVLAGAGCSLGGSSSNVADGGIFKSTDGATKWAASNAVPSAKGVGTLSNVDTITISFDPEDHNTLYLGTKGAGMLWSIDGGTSWMQPRDGQVQSGDVYSIAVDPKDECTIYAVIGSHLYRSDNCNRTFTSEYDEARGGVSLRKVAIDWFNSNNVFIALSNGDILKSVDKGEHWSTLVSTQNDISELIVSASDSRILLAATTDGVFKTVDGGTTWTHLNEPLNNFDDSGNIFALVQDATGKILYSSSHYGILRSSDLAESWEALKLVTAPNQVQIRAMAIDPTDTDVIYYATSSTFYKSTDGGSTWETSKLPTSRAANILKVDPSATSTLYMGTLKLEK